MPIDIFTYINLSVFVSEIVEVDYADSIAISGSLFKVERIEMLSPAKRYGLLGILSLVLIISIIFIIVLMKEIFVEKFSKK